MKKCGVSEANLEVAPNGLSLMAMDKDRVLLVSLTMGKAAFQSLHCRSRMRLGVHLATMHTILNTAKKDDALTLTATEDGNTLNFLFQPPGSDAPSEFALNLKEVEDLGLGVPECEYDAKITMPSERFKKMCKDMAGLSDVVTIVVDPEKGQANFHTEEHAMSSDCRVLPNEAEDEDERVRVSAKTRIGCAYALKHLEHMCTSAALSPTVSLQLARAAPLLVTFKFRGGHIQYYLAPRVDEDEVRPSQNDYSDEEEDPPVPALPPSPLPLLPAHPNDDDVPEEAEGG